MPFNPELVACPVAAVAAAAGVALCEPGLAALTHRQFADLIRIVAEAQGIAPALVEKDYWIMQSLYGLQQLGLLAEEDLPVA